MSGQRAFIPFVAVIPSIRGIRISMRITSGGWRCVDKRSVIAIAASPSCAVSTTAKSGSISRSLRNPSRTSVWSSTINMRIGSVMLSPLGLLAGQKEAGLCLFEEYECERSHGSRTAPEVRKLPVHRGVRYVRVSRSSQNLQDAAAHDHGRSQRRCRVQPVPGSHPHNADVQGPSLHARACAHLSKLPGQHGRMQAGVLMRAAGEQYPDPEFTLYSERLL